MGRLHVRETFAQARDATPSGGDAVALGAHHVAVIDGVTGQSTLRFDGMPADQFAAREVASAIQRLDAEIDATAAMAAISRSLADATRALGFDEQLTALPGAVVAVVALERDELWLVGDTTAVCDGTVLQGAPPPTDAVLCALRAAYLEALLEAGATTDELMVDDPSQPLLRAMFERQWLFANHPDSRWGYGVINGTPVPDRYIAVHSLAGVTDVVLATDGIAAPAATLADTLEAHAAIMAADPLCIRENVQLVRCRAGGWDDLAYVHLAR